MLHLDFHPNPVPALSSRQPAVFALHFLLNCYPHTFRDLPITPIPQISRPIPILPYLTGLVFRRNGNEILPFLTLNLYFRTRSQVDRSGCCVSRRLTYHLHNVFEDAARETAEQIFPSVHCFCWYTRGMSFDTNVTKGRCGNLLSRKKGVRVHAV